MDFEVSEKMSTMLAMIREFMDREVIPLEGEMLHGDPATLEAGVKAAQAKVKQMGLWAPNHPIEFGGLGLSMVDHGLFAEAVGRSPLGMTVFGTQAPDAGNIEILHKYATEEQRERFLRPLVAGEIRSCFSMTEPETAGSNPVLLATTAVTDGDDYVINGQKWFTSSADGADVRDRHGGHQPRCAPAPAGQHDHRPDRHPRLQPGAQRQRDGPLRVGPRQPRRGDLPVVPSPANEPARARRQRLPHRPGSPRARAASTTACAGSASRARAFDMMCTRANERVIDIDGGTLADKQVIQHWAAELEAEIRGVRLQTLHAAWMIDRHGASAARDEISAIKFEVANTMLKAVDTAIQVHGALGVTDDTILAYWYRHERAARIYDGADEVHKTSLGRRILRRYARAAEQAECSRSGSRTNRW